MQFNFEAKIDQDGGFLKGSLFGFEVNWNLTGEQVQKFVAELLPQILQAISK